MILSVKNLKKYYGGIKALDDCSFSISTGRITAIIGPNGSGKSTLFHVISNIEQKDEGRVELFGKNISSFKAYQVAQSGITRTFQDVRLFSNLTIKDHLEIALSKTDQKLFFSFFKKEKNRDEKIKKILDLVQLDKPLDTYASDLSYGQQKLLDLAIALAKTHSLLLLDEPVAGVNPRLRKKIKRILQTLNDNGETILLIEHDMEFVMDLADHIIVMDEGKVIAQGKPQDIQNDRKVLDAYLGG